MSPVSIGYLIASVLACAALVTPTAVIAQQGRIVSAIVGDDVDVAVIIVVGSGQAASGYGANEIGPERI